VHELSIALSILELAGEESERCGGAFVKAIYLKLGVLSGVGKEALASAFELATERSKFETCRLVIEEVSISGYCPKCQGERSVHSLQCLQCVDCGAYVSKISHGKELEVSALELAC
jgi:hydrogenase nickel incorporation protein HypA/HybF